MQTVAIDIMLQFTNALASVLAWIDVNFGSIVQAFFIVVVAMITARIVCRLFGRVLSQAMRADMFPTKTDREKRLKTLTAISNAIIKTVIWAVAFIMILNKLGLNTAPLLASAGIIGVALGFGSQSLVKDFMTGMFIIAENQYRVGDYVEIQNVSGTVKSITMRTTVVQNDEGSLFHIPNGSIIVTANHTMNNSRLSFELSASTDTDLEKLQTIINKVGNSMAKHVDMKDLVIAPIKFERIKDIKGGSILLGLSGRVMAGKQTTVKSAYFEALQDELVKNKIALK